MTCQKLLFETNKNLGCSLWRSEAPGLTYTEYIDRRGRPSTLQRGGPDLYHPRKGAHLAVWGTAPARCCRLYDNAQVAQMVVRERSHPERVSEVS